MKVEDFRQTLTSMKYNLSDLQSAQLQSYCELLQEWNRKMNLTAIYETEEVYEKHFLDCICALNKEVQGSVLDVGSGAGFPGLVWKIMHPDLSVTLLEPTQKRCRFLSEVINQLHLEDIEVVNQRAEDFVKEQREAFDIVTARAVADLAVLSELCLPLLRVGGIFIAMKGSNAEEEIKRAESAIKVLGAEIEYIDNRILPFGERNNIVIRKRKETSKKYPRRYDQIKKRPL